MMGPSELGSCSSIMTRPQSLQTFTCIINYSLLEIIANAFERSGTELRVKRLNPDPDQSRLITLTLEDVLHLIFARLKSR